MGSRVFPGCVNQQHAHLKNLGVKQTSVGPRPISKPCFPELLSEENNTDLFFENKTQEIEIHLKQKIIRSEEIEDDSEDLANIQQSSGLSPNLASAPTTEVETTFQKE